MNVNDAFGMRAFVHGGKEPYIRLTTRPADKLSDCVRLLQILYDERKRENGAPGLS